MNRHYLSWTEILLLLQPIIGHDSQAFQQPPFLISYVDIFQEAIQILFSEYYILRLPLVGTCRKNRNLLDVATLVTCIDHEVLHWACIIRSAFYAVPSSSYTSLAFLFFLGAFAKLLKTTISFVIFCLSVCPSFRPHRTTELPLDGFSWIFTFDCFSKICRENWSFFKTW
jgi:hypothetical protein